MATATVPQVPGFSSSATFRQFTIDQYHHMIRTGVLPEGEPVELLEGYMVQKMARGTPHDSTLDGLEGALPPLLPSGWFCRGKRALTILNSEPEPDLAVVRGPRNRYLARHPLPADVGLLVEVSASSLDIDRLDKARIYARAGIPAYWVVNLVDRVVEVFTRPSGPADAPAYGKRDDYKPGDAVPVVLDGVEVGRVAVSEVMP